MAQLICTHLSSYISRAFQFSNKEQRLRPVEQSASKGFMLLYMVPWHNNDAWRDSCCFLLTTAYGFECCFWGHCCISTNVSGHWISCKKTGYWVPTHLWFASNTGVNYENDMTFQECYADSRRDHDPSCLFVSEGNFPLCRHWHFQSHHGSAPGQWTHRCRSCFTWLPLTSGTSSSWTEHQPSDPIRDSVLTCSFLFFVQHEQHCEI